MTAAPLPPNDPATWYRVLVDDSSVSEPAGFRVLLKLVLSHIPAEAAAVAHFEGVWKRDTLHRMEDRVQIFSFEELDQELEKVVQIDWGRFFLLHNSTDISPRESRKPGPHDLEQRIALSATTICVADDSYYFVFTQSPALVTELLTQPWPVEVIKNTLPNILKMPEEF